MNQYGKKNGQKNENMTAYLNKSWTQISLQVNSIKALRDR